MYSNRIVRTKVSADFQATYSNSFKRQQFHAQTGSVSPCRITADNFYTAKLYTANQTQPKAEEKIVIIIIFSQLKKSQLDVFVHEIEKLNDILTKKVSIIGELTNKLNQCEEKYREKNYEFQSQQSQYQKQKDEQQAKIAELLLTINSLKETNFQQSQELEGLFNQIEQYNKESQKFKDALKNSQTLNSESEMKQLKMEINNQKQEITKLQIQILEEKKESNLLRLQVQEVNNAALNKQSIHELEDQQNIIDTQKQQIAQLRKTINLLEQNITDQFQSENLYSSLLNNFSQFKEQQKEQENKLTKIIRSKENEIADLDSNFKSQQLQLEQSNLLVISLQNQNEKLKNMLKAKIDETDVKKNDSETTHALSYHNKTTSKKTGKECSGTPQNNHSQHQQINFIKEQCRQQLPISTQHFERELQSYKNRMNSPSNIKIRQEQRDGNNNLNKKVL